MEKALCHTYGNERVFHASWAHEGPTKLYSHYEKKDVFTETFVSTVYGFTMTMTSAKKKNTSYSRITKMKISIWSTSLPQNEGDNLGYIGSPRWLPLTRLRRPRWKGATREVPPLLRIGPKMDFMGFPQNFPYPNWSFWAYFYADDMIEGNLHQRIKLCKKKKKKAEKIVTHQLSEKKELTERRRRRGFSEPQMHLLIRRFTVCVWLHSRCESALIRAGGGRR